MILSMKATSWAPLVVSITSQIGYVQAEPGSFFSQLQPCPAPCSAVGPDPKNWTIYTNVQRLSQCNSAVVFDFNIHTPPELLSTHTTVRACTDADNTFSTRLKGGTASCGSSTSTSATVEVASWGSPNLATNSSTIAATSSLRHQLASNTTCDSTIMFAFNNDTIIGLYGGASIMGNDTVDSMTNLLLSQAQERGIGSSLVAQVCGQGADGEHTLGAVVSTTGDFAFVQAAMRQWANASCVTGFDRSVSTNITVSQKPVAAPIQSRKRDIVSRSTCSFIQVVSGDGCGSLATKCGISENDFTSFNPDPNLCSTLAVGQPVCCSAGSLPDLRPQPNPDGSCATYTVQADDYCALIASEHTIAVDDIENFNKETWGWQGCSNIQLGQIICLSSGKPTDVVAWYSIITC